MELTSEQEQQIIKEIRKGDTLILIVGRNGEVPKSRKQIIITQGEGNLMARDMKGALLGNQVLNMIVAAAVGEITAPQPEQPAAEKAPEPVKESVAVEQENALPNVYHLLDSDNKGQKIAINETGAKIIWEARVKTVPEKLNFDRELDAEQQECGSILSTTGLARLIKHGFLPADFNYKQYIVTE